MSKLYSINLPEDTWINLVHELEVGLIQRVGAYHRAEEELKDLKKKCYKAAYLDYQKLVIALKAMGCLEQSHELTPNLFYLGD